MEHYPPTAPPLSHWNTTLRLPRHCLIGTIPSSCPATVSLEHYPPAAPPLSHWNNSLQLPRHCLIGTLPSGCPATVSLEQFPPAAPQLSHWNTTLRLPRHCLIGTLPSGCPTTVSLVHCPPAAPPLYHWNNSLQLPRHCLIGTLPSGCPATVSLEHYPPAAPPLSHWNTTLRLPRHCLIGTLPSGCPATVTIFYIADLHKAVFNQIPVKTQDLQTRTSMGAYITEISKPIKEKKPFLQGEKNYYKKKRNFSIINMLSGSKEPKSLPTILINLKTMTSHPANDGQPLGKTSLASIVKPTYDPRLRGNRVPGSHVSLPRARTSSISSLASLKFKVKGGNEHTRSASQLSRSSSLLSLGAAPHTLRGKKKREAEYTAQKVTRQRQEMAEFYRGTPLTNQHATSSEIIRYLYELWGPQLSPSYRKEVPVTTNCRQDLRNVRKIAQATPRRVRKLHRAKLVIETCNQMSKPNELESRSSSVTSLIVT
ncbi:hypothetical protein Btru_066887 [Bulinus truncatus]|nr:hypothetical protein Btru_066887 [Bulinus truncatus]